MAAVGLTIVTVLWQSIIWIFNVPIYLVPSPIDVGKAIAQDYELLLISAGTTTMEALLGFLLGNTIAIIVAGGFKLEVLHLCEKRVLH